MYNFIDVSGLGNSGKSVVVDLLREFEDVYAPHLLFEFDIFRRPGGIFDLYHHIVENWSLIRSNQAVFDFIELTHRLGGYGRKKSLRSILFSSGTEFELFFNKKFHHLSREYIQSFIVGSHQVFWPYYLDNDNCSKRLLKKIKIKYFKDSPPKEEVYFVSGDSFSEKTGNYLSSLYREIVEPRTTHIVMNNSFDAFHPEYGTHILPNSKSVIVIRDPRDVYVSSLNKTNLSQRNRDLLPPENSGVNKNFTGSDDLSGFILRQKILFEKLYRGHHDNIMVVKFEDVVLRYEETVPKIMTFCGIEKVRHKDAKKFLDPNKSKKNIGLYTKYSDQQTIRKIESALKHDVPEYL